MRARKVRAFLAHAIQMRRVLRVRQRAGVCALHRIDEQRPGPTDETDETFVVRQPLACCRHRILLEPQPLDRFMQRTKRSDSLLGETAIELGRPRVVTQSESECLERKKKVAEQKSLSQSM